MGNNVFSRIGLGVRLQIGVAVMAIASVLIALYAPAPIQHISLDSGRPVSESACIPWQSTLYDTTRLVNAVAAPLNDASVGAKYSAKSIALEPGTLQALSNSSDSGVLTVEGNGADRSGGFVQSLTDTGLGLGASTAACTPPSQDWWFSGIDTTSGASAMLWLFNPDSEQVVALVEGYNRDGKDVAAGEKQLVVPAGASVKLDLTLSFPAQPAVAVHVHTAEGRLAASVQAWQVSGPLPRGRSFITGVTAPAERSVIVGLRQGADESTLQLVAPNSDAEVTVSLVTNGGAAVLASADRLQMAAGEVKMLQLSQLVTAHANALVIESTAPVVAAVRQMIDKSGVKDLDVLSQQSSVKGNSAMIIPAGARGAALIAYADTESKLTLTAYSGGNQEWKRDFTLLPGVSRSIDLSGALEDGFVFVESTQPVFLTQWLVLASHTSSSAALERFSGYVIAGTSLLLTVS